jgi:hypothetical protein
VPSYVVESYAAGSADAPGDAPERARQAALLATRDGIDVRYVRTTFLPGDETCFHVFEAESLEAVKTAIALSSLPADRVVPAVEQIEPRIEIQPGEGN